MLRRIKSKFEFKVGFSSIEKGSHSKIQRDPQYLKIKIPWTLGLTLRKTSLRTTKPQTLTWLTLYFLIILATHTIKYLI